MYVNMKRVIYKSSLMPMLFPKMYSFTFSPIYQMCYNENRISDYFIKEAVVSIVEEALTLKPIERLHLVDKLLLSLMILLHTMNISSKT